jgi:hypothetical protein
LWPIEGLNHIREEHLKGQTVTLDVSPTKATGERAPTIPDVEALGRKAEQTKGTNRMPRSYCGVLECLGVGVELPCIEPEMLGAGPGGLEVDDAGGPVVTGHQGIQPPANDARTVSPWDLQGSRLHPMIDAGDDTFGGPGEVLGTAAQEAPLHGTVDVAKEGRERCLGACLTQNHFAVEAAVTLVP